MTTDTLLERLDLALAGDPSADADLTALVADVRDQAPQMTPQFAATLDERVRAGFASEPGAARSRRRWRLPNLYVMGPLAAGAAAVLVIVAVSGGGSSSTSPTTSALAQHGAAVKSSPSAVPESAAKSSSAGAGGAAAGVPAPSDSATPSAAAPERTPAPTPATPQGFATPAPNRRVERTTQLALSTTTDEVQPVAAGVVRVTQQAQGFVAASQVAIDGNHGGATFTLRIPSARLEPTLTALGRLARVTSMSQSTQDITGEFTSTNTRLARLQRRLAGLHAIKVQTPVVRLHERQVSAALAAERRALGALRHRADYVTVNLTVTGHGRHHHVAPVHHGSGFTPGRALRDVGHILVVGAGVAIVALAILIPLALLAAACALAARSLRRRSREAMLKTS